jgi:hypothetical protein
MKLRDVIDAVMTANDWDQAELGKHIGAPQKYGFTNYTTANPDQNYFI